MKMNAGFRAALRAREFVQTLEKRDDVVIHDCDLKMGSKLAHREKYNALFPADYLDFVETLGLEFSWSFKDLYESLEGYDSCLSGGRIVAGSKPPLNERSWEERPATTIFTGPRGKKKELDLNIYPVLANTDNDYLAYGYPASEQWAARHLMLLYGRIDFMRLDCGFAELICTGIVFGFGWDFPSETYTDFFSGSDGIGYEEPLRAAIRLANGKSYDLRRLLLPPIVRAKALAMRKKWEKIPPMLVGAGYPSAKAEKITRGLRRQVLAVAD